MVGELRLGAAITNAGKRLALFRECRDRSFDFVEIRMQFNGHELANSLRELSRRLQIKSKVVNAPKQALIWVPLFEIEVKLEDRFIRNPVIPPGRSEIGDGRCENGEKQKLRKQKAEMEGV